MEPRKHIVAYHRSTQTANILNRNSNERRCRFEIRAFECGMSRRLLYFHDDQRAVVGDGGAVREVVDRGEQAVGEIAGGKGGILLDELTEPPDAEEAPLGVRRFRQAIGMEDQDLAGIELERPLFVRQIIVNAERKTDQLQLL